MTPSTRCRCASEAARRLGVSVKALRLYEQQGLLRPGRTAAGYRSYRDSDMARAAEVVGLRALGLSLAEVARILDGEARQGAKTPVRSCARPVAGRRRTGRAARAHRPGRRFGV